MPSTADSGALSVRQAVAANLHRLRTERDWNFMQLNERLQNLGGGLSRATLSRLEQPERKVREAGQPTRVADLRVQDLLDLARAFEVSPLTLLSPPDRASLRLGETGTAQVVSARRFRDWLLGRRPLPGADSERYYGNLPDAMVPQSEEWNELQSLAAEAVWAAQDPDAGYEEAMGRKRDFERRLNLLMEQLELSARKRDPQGHARWERRRREAARRDSDVD